tara:strand:- start:164 stop:385 length:222 start_codon:yes stop_codon:yes gene_type:complete
MSDYDVDAGHLHLIDETPIDALQQYGEMINSDMLVMGAISRSRISEALVGSTAETVLDYVKTDVLILKPAVSE